MLIVTTTGYYATGSSAITDLLSEFSSVHVKSNQEIRFLHDIFGVSDLEYFIVENYNRHNSGYALKRFKQNIDYWSGNSIIKRYESFFDGNFKTKSYDYIDSLTKLKYKGYWHQDVLDKGRLIYNFLRLISKVYYYSLGKKIRGFYELPNETTYLVDSSHENFISKTLTYTDNLFNSIKTSKSIIHVDQLVPPNNVNRYMRYLKNLKVIIVDRDPRDQFLMEAEILRGGVVPTKNIHDFVEWYKSVRIDYKNTDSDNVLRIMFEELIYDYEKVLAKIIHFLSLNSSNHVSKMVCFDPLKSKSNTQLWKRFPHQMTKIKVIEETLSEYLYDFPV
jgi:hypothetical protein